MSRTPFSARLRYAFDNSMSRGAIALIGYLGLASILSHRVFCPDRRPLPYPRPRGAISSGFIEAAWLSLMRTLDAGTMGGDEGWRSASPCWSSRSAASSSSARSSASSPAASRASSTSCARAARAWSRAATRSSSAGRRQIFTIISELVHRQREPAASRASSILADSDKVEMEDEIRDAGRRHRHARASSAARGSPIDLDDLEIVNPHDARVDHRPGAGGRRPGLDVIKTILALTNNPERAARAVPHRRRDPRPARTWRRRGWWAATKPSWSLVGDLIARIIVADLPPVGPVGGLHRAAGLRRRRDLLPARSRRWSARPSARRCSPTRTRAVIGLQPRRRRGQL